MARRTRTEPSLTEWAALGVLCERPAHGWDVARRFAPGEDFGSVWSVSRALVYRAIVVLRELGYIVDKGTEPSTRGPHRVLLAPTPRGRQALRRWLAGPAEHVRDLRSELLVKLLLLDRAGKESAPLAEGAACGPPGRRAGSRRSGCPNADFERTVCRLAPDDRTRSSRSFVEALLDERSGEPVNYEAIGYVDSPHTSLDGMPLQPQADTSGPSRIVLTEPHRGGLADLDAFSHIWVIAHLHESIGWAATVDPFLDDQRRGTFATRSPHRPNPISLSLCRLIAVETDSVVVQGLDLLDRTPVLDIKPFVPLFDSPTTPASSGWFEGRAERIFERTSDSRFKRRSQR